MNRRLAWSILSLLVGWILGPGEAIGAARAPHPRNPSYSYDVLDNSLVRPATRALDVARLARDVTGHPREAANVDDADQVRLPSTWWQPRVGFHAVTPRQILGGPGPGTGPAPGPWTVVKGKAQGVTPGFQIRDARGDRFLIKFDPPGYPDLASGADVIGCRLLWAAGYNVPDDAVATFRAEDLQIDPKASYTDPSGHKRPMTRAYLDGVLAQVDRRADGSFRCITSRLLPGTPLGPFAYRGRRPDDPEDRVPHELRRELRGLWALCAWIDHADSRSPNTLDMWVTEGDRSFVRHYLIDFSAVLGAGPRGPRWVGTGTEYYADFRTMGREAGTLGLAPFEWERWRASDLPAIGGIDPDHFDAAGWRPDYPNPAFDERTARDVRWGARIVASFTDEQIRAVVGFARFTDPRAAATMTRLLVARRDAIARRFGLAGTPPPPPPTTASLRAAP